MLDLVPREQWEYDVRVRLEWMDVSAAFTTAFLILIFAFMYQSRKQRKDPAYKFVQFTYSITMAEILSHILSRRWPW
jgi:uncharacterized membrane protein YjjP (DUF1212 family)